MLVPSTCDYLNEVSVTDCNGSGIFIRTMKKLKVRVELIEV